VDNEEDDELEEDVDSDESVGEVSEVLFSLAAGEE
jgi:hypothetical protein